MAFLELEIRELDALIGGLIKSSRQQEPYRLVQTIPGIWQEAAANILAETGLGINADPRSPLVRPKSQAGRSL
jgi:hypothetical protein